MGQTEREAAQERADDLAYEAHQERMREAYEEAQEEKYNQEMISEGKFFHGLMGGTDKALEEIELKDRVRRVCIGEIRCQIGELINEAVYKDYEVKQLAEVTGAPKFTKNDEAVMEDVDEPLYGVHFALPDGKRVLLNGFYYATKKRDEHGSNKRRYYSVETLRMLKLADVHADLALAIKMSEDPDPPWKYDALRDGAFPRLVWFGEPKKED